MQAEVRDRRADGATILTREGIVLYAHGAVVGRMAVPRAGPTADPPSSN